MSFGIDSTNLNGAVCVLQHRTIHLQFCVPLETEAKMGAEPSYESKEYHGIPVYNSGYRYRRRTWFKSVW